MITIPELIYNVTHEGKIKFVDEWLKGVKTDFDMDMILLDNKRDIEMGKLYTMRNDL